MLLSEKNNYELEEMTGSTERETIVVKSLSRKLGLLLRSAKILILNAKYVLTGWLVS